MTTRRTFITLLGGAAAAWPMAARAQQTERVRRIGVLIPIAGDRPDAQANIAAFLQGMQQFGWTDGRNVQIDYRWGAGDADLIRKHAAELAALAPDVIFATGGPTVGPLRQATRTVPIVFAVVPDPVGSGFVDSLARPGGNATGFMQFEYSLSAKWPELLKQVAPGVTRAAVFWEPAIPAGIGQFAVIQAMAPSVGVEVSPISGRDTPRDRASYRGLRPLLAWGHDRDGERVGECSSKSDRRSRGPAQTARGLPRPRLRHRWRPDFLWG